MAESQGFKKDLLDRLSFEVLFLPPLRHRGEDIMLLANHFAMRMAFELGRDAIPQFTEAAAMALEQYSWKGNIRELKNVVERAVYRADSAVIEKLAFDPFISPYALGPAIEKEPVKPQPAPYTPEQDEGSVSLKQAVEKLEKTMIRQALKVCRHNRRRAADQLGLTYDQFRGRMRKYGSAVLE